MHYPQWLYTFVCLRLVDKKSSLYTPCVVKVRLPGNT